MKAAYIHANLLDGTVQMKPVQDTTVIVENGKIISVAADGSAPPDAKIIDLNGKYLMPGLINLHCHLAGNGKPQKVSSQTVQLVQKQIDSRMGNFLMKSFCAQNAKVELFSGVTTVRTVGGLGNIDTALRDEIREGKRIGPRILAGNTAISVPGGHMAGTLACISHSPKEAESLACKIISENPDLLKLMITGGSLDMDNPGSEYRVLMSPQEISVACKAAHEHGLKVAAHVQGMEGIRAALKNGVDTIEHGGELDAELIEMFKQSKAAFVATFSPCIVLAALPVEVTKTSEVLKESCADMVQQMRNGVKTALANNIPVGLGTDPGSPYITQYSMWRELEYFHRYVGVSNAFALHTATLKNAEIAGIDDETGSIAPGKSADMIVTDKDPLKDLSNLASPEIIVMAGQVYEKPKQKINQKYEKMLNSIKEYDNTYRA